MVETLSLNPIDITDVVFSTPDITQLTTQSITGTGVFDVLMGTVKLHLIEEYTAGRITGEEYATVYIGALSAILQQSNAFLANHQEKEQIRANIGLTRQQTVSELAKTDNTIVAGLGFNGDTTIEGLIANELSLGEKQIELADSQIETATREGVLVGQKIVTELAQTDDNISAEALAYALNGDTAIEGLIAAQVSKMDTESDLIIQKLVTEVANTSTTKPLSLGQMSSTTDIDGLAKSQREKIDSETDLLTQKTETELAQVYDTLTTGSVVGVVGKQKNLFQAQTDGFSRDAEQKAAKILVDAWAVNATMNEATANTNNKLDDTSVGEVMTKLKAGI